MGTPKVMVHPCEMMTFSVQFPMNERPGRRLWLEHQDEMGDPDDQLGDYNPYLGVQTHTRSKPTALFTQQLFVNMCPFSLFLPYEHPENSK